MHVWLGWLTTALSLGQLAAIGVMFVAARKMRDTFKHEIAARHAMLAALQHVIGRQAATLLAAGLNPFGEADPPRHLDS